MKLLILSTGNSFTPSMLYKENYLIKAAIEKGHEVIVYANQYTYNKGQLCKVDLVEPTKGFKLKRFPYKNYGLDVLTRKIRRIDGLEKEIINEKPDLLFVNCAQIYNVKNVGAIKAALPNLKIVMDFSTKYLNSARNWFAKNILHNIIYRCWIQTALPFVDKVFFISAESRDFAMEMYGIPSGMMEHNNLPGETIPKEIKYAYRSEIRERMGLKDELFLLYSGKIYPDKRVDQLIRAFSRVNDLKLRLLIIGAYTCDDAHRNEVQILIDSDKRITFMSFVSGEELTKYVCACDLYLQPGSISQTCQTAVCCGTPLCFNDVPTHREIYNGNGFFADSEEELYDVIKSVSDNPSQLEKMSELSYKMADEELDYKIIYCKILSAVNLL